ncbi:DnaJ [Cryptosporidium ryanae]|uniref:DnaJ n=1 Tax=Cryptosporidium ryanae TaxID=515981 RepID=UPI00351A1782|nr:DnaJ [Cryptosporidium ryanae]
MTSYCDYLSAYKLLRLEVGVSTDEIKYAYRKLAKEIHPDKNRYGDYKTAHENFTKLLNAYVLLRDETGRRRFEESFKSKDNTRKISVREDKNELDKHKIQHKRKMYRNMEEIEKKHTLEKLLHRLRKESLPLINLYKTTFEKSEAIEKNFKSNCILQRILKEKTNNIIGEFEQFEQMVLRKLRRFDL